MINLELTTEQAAGEQAAQGLFAQAEQTRLLGKTQAAAQRTKAFTSLLEGATSTYSQYGKLFPSTPQTTTTGYTATPIPRP